MSKFDENNKLKTDDNLKIEGLNGVYAIGDCCNKSMTAGAAAAGDHAKLVASNFIREIKGQDLQPYKASKLLHFLVNKLYIFDINVVGMSLEKLLDMWQNYEFFNIQATYS